MVYVDAGERPRGGGESASNDGGRTDGWLVPTTMQASGGEGKKSKRQGAACQLVPGPPVCQSGAPVGKVGWWDGMQSSSASTMDPGWMQGAVERASWRSRGNGEVQRPVTGGTQLWRPRYSDIVGPKASRLPI